MYYGQKIIKLRKMAGMTQAELGKELNVTSQAVSKWENGLSEPDLETISKMCKLFNVSPNEFFDAEQPQAEESSAPKSSDTKIINGYCERCCRPVGPGEYKVFAREFKSDGVYNGMQELLCNDCVKKKEEEIRIQNERKKYLERAQNKKRLSRGIMWGSIAAAIVLIFGIVYIIQSIIQGEATIQYEGMSFTMSLILLFISCLIVCYGFFAVISQLIWGHNSVAEVLFFFCRSFKMPVMILFDFDLGGCLFAICFKLFLALLSALLSVACFAVGFVVTMIYAMFAFPFSLAYEIREMKEI